MKLLAVYLALQGYQKPNQTVRQFLTIAISEHIAEETERLEELDNLTNNPGFYEAMDKVAGDFAIYLVHRCVITDAVQARFEDAVEEIAC